MARGRFLFSGILSLLIVLAVALPFRAAEVAGGIGPARYIAGLGAEQVGKIYDASRMVCIVEMAGAVVVAFFGANLGSRVSRWIVKESDEDLPAR